jgi:hypothetical protein
MKKTFIFYLLFHCAMIAYSQPLPDSVLAKYRSAKTDEEKERCISTYLKTPSSSNKSSDRILALSSWFKKQNDEVGADYTDLCLSNFLITKGDFSAALKIALPILPRFEKRNDNYGIIASNESISNAYFLAKDYEPAADYSKKVIPLLTKDNGKDKLSRVYNGIGCIYGEAGIPDSGMVYAQKAVDMDMQMKNFQQLALSISTLAENYIAAQEYDIALPFLRKSLDYYLSRKAKPNARLYAYLKNDFAQVFLATKHYDSANYYAKDALQSSIPSEDREQSMRSYEYLYKIFEQTNRQDSVNKYFRLAMTIRDSLYSTEKTKSMEALSFREQMRQQELAMAKIKEEEERTENIQYALIAIGLVTIVILFLFLSRNFITNTKLIVFFGVIALLLVFEFLNLILHPFLERITHHSPVLMLLALVCIAAFLVPLHHRLEKWTTTSLVEKNKATRLANARKTIEQLQGKS